MATYIIKRINDEEIKKCCICGEEIKGYGNNPYPVCTDEDAECCDKCNYEKVIPARIESLMGSKIKDSEDMIDKLIASEEKAIDEYMDAIEKCEDMHKIDVFKHILKEEQEHLEELKELKKNNLGVNLWQL